MHLVKKNIITPQKGTSKILNPKTHLLCSIPEMYLIKLKMQTFSSLQLKSANLTLSN